MESPQLEDHRSSVDIAFSARGEDDLVIDAPALMGSQDQDDQDSPKPEHWTIIL